MLHTIFACFPFGHMYLIVVKETGGLDVGVVEV
jgi:hypothetical protein